MSKGKDVLVKVPRTLIQTLRDSNSALKAMKYDAEVVRVSLKLYLEEIGVELDDN